VASVGYKGGILLCAVGFFLWASVIDINWIDLGDLLVKLFAYWQGDWMLRKGEPI